METQVPAVTRLLDRLNEFADFLDDRLTHVEELLAVTPILSDHHYCLKTERAELVAVHTEFSRFFDKEMHARERSEIQES
jgi:hypothetical protein